MKPAVDEMFPEGAGPYVDLDEAGGSTGLLMDLAANEKAVHADFFNVTKLNLRMKGTALPTLVIVWVRVQEEAHESGIVEVVSIDPIFVPVPVHLEPDLIPGAEVQQDRAAGLVHVVVLELVRLTLTSDR
ncbi:hypothetical protein DV515_00011634 [Chloebia gouldiae]|uniref:COP9 signalosome complex subunit 9 n=1 Tax=Chloebia gouldiae TaxID=44316 RepID=A0A3L8S5Y6_CHLGU|nr:hypothetical protein DV515_00011634 [Chloebia gouldiae]